VTENSAAFSVQRQRRHGEASSPHDLLLHAIVAAGGGDEPAVGESEPRLREDGEGVRLVPAALSQPGR
jgi:hypothetical protein